MRLIENVRKHCEEEGPVAPREIFVSVQSESTIDLYVDVAGFENLDESAFRSDVEKYFDSLQAGDIFVKAQIIVFAIKHGASNATVTYTVNGGTSLSADYYKPSPEEKLVLGELTEV